MLNFHDYIKEDFQIPYDLEEDIRDTINKGFRLLKFPSRLEKRYHQDIFPLQQERYLKLGIWAILLYNLFIFTDWFMIRDIYLTAWITRLGICTPLMVFALFMVNSSSLKRFINLLISILIFLVGVSIIFFLTISSHPNVIHYHTGVILVVIFSNIVLRIPFWYAFFTSFVILFVYILAIPHVFQMPVEVMINSSLVIMCAIIITLIGNYRMEKDLRRDYLLTMLQMIDNSKLEDANAKLEKLSLLDPLTGLANRRHFDHRLEQEIRTSMREGNPLSLILLDIDHFKLFNDNYGHPSGDNCLQQIANALKENINRPHDLVARYGGEEFVILLPYTHPDKATKLAEKIRSYVENLGIEHRYSDISSFVTVSLGISGGIIESGQDKAGLLENADKALYQAKLSGRNRVCSFQ